MSETATKPKTGTPTVLAEYECDGGTRQLVGQRVNGTVHISDIPSGDHGRVHLVEKRIGCLKELDALVADYLHTAQRTGRCPMEGWL